MKTISLSATLALSLCLVHAGCSDDDSNTDTTDTNRDSSTAPRDASTNIDSSLSDAATRADTGIDSSVAQLTDSQIAGVLATVNTGEIDQGTLASSKAQNAAILQYGTTMVAHHTESQTELTTLLASLGLTQATSAVSEKLKSDATATLTRLQGLPAGVTFDHDYIAAQALQHQTVLDIIDAQLLPSVDAPDLKAFVQKTRTIVQTHLSHAQVLVNDYGIGADGGVVGGPDGGADANF